MILLGAKEVHDRTARDVFICSRGRRSGLVARRQRDSEEAARLETAAGRPRATAAPPLTPCRCPSPLRANADGAASDWLHALAAEGPTGDAAARRLQVVLLRAARFEVERRQAGLPDQELDPIACAAADAALVSARAQLHAFRGGSFTTWAAKFAVVEAAVRSRRRAWDGRELPQSGTREALAKIRRRAHERCHLSALEEAIDALPADERRVLTALALEGVPIDVLAERDGTSRAVLYETLREARRKLRGHLGGAESLSRPA